MRRERNKAVLADWITMKGDLALAFARWSDKSRRFFAS